MQQLGCVKNLPRGVRIGDTHAEHVTGKTAARRAGSGVHLVADPELVPDGIADGRELAGRGGGGLAGHAIHLQLQRRGSAVGSRQICQLDDVLHIVGRQRHGLCVVVPCIAGRVRGEAVFEVAAVRPHEDVAHGGEQCGEVAGRLLRTVFHFGAESLVHLPARAEARGRGEGHAVGAASEGDAAAVKLGRYAAVLGHGAPRHLVATCGVGVFSERAAERHIEVFRRIRRHRDVRQCHERERRNRYQCGESAQPRTRASP